MKRCLTILLIIVCLFLAVYKCLACILPLYILIEQDTYYTEVGQSVPITANEIDGGPVDTWDWGSSGLNISIDEGSWDSTATVSSSTSGTYTVYVDAENEGGSQDSDSATVYIVAVTGVDVQDDVSVALPGDYVYYTPVTDPSGLAPDVNMQWTWYDDNNEQQYQEGAVFATSWNEPGSKTVTAVCGNSRTDSASVEIIDVELTSPTSQTYIEVDEDLSISCNAFGSTGGTYEWSASPGTATFSDIYAQNPDFSSSTAGDYTVQVTYTKGGVTATSGSSGTITVEDPVVVDSVSVNKTTAAIGETVTFTAYPNPSGAVFDDIHWERQYRPDSTSQWEDWEEVSGSGTNTAELNTSTSGFYVYRARNGDDDIGKESSIVTIVSVNTIVEAVSGDGGSLYKEVGDSFALEAKPSPSGASCPSCGIDWSMESYPPGAEGSWTLPSHSSGFTVPVQINSIGNYTIRGKCGPSDTGSSIDINVVDVSVEITGRPDMNYTLHKYGLSLSCDGTPGGGTYHWSSDPDTGTFTNSDAQYPGDFTASESGIYTITVEYDYNGIIKTDSITIVDVAVTDVEVIEPVPGQVTFPVDQDIKFKATTHPSDAIDHINISWEAMIQGGGQTDSGSGVGMSEFTTSWGFSGPKTVKASSGIYSSDEINVTIVDEEVVVALVTADKTVQAVGEAVTFTAHADPTGSTLSSLVWEKQYCPDSTFQWGDWEAASGSVNNTAELNTPTPGFYKYRARNGSEHTWIECQDVITIVKVSNVTFSPAELYADNASSSDADADIEPDTRTIEWSIVEPVLGCNIDSSTGVITVTASTTPGTITVRAADSGLLSCYAENNIEIKNISVEIKSCPDLFAIGSTASASATTTPPDRPVTWSIVGNGWGSAIDSTGGITTGTPETSTGGPVFIRAADSEFPDIYDDDYFILFGVRVTAPPKANPAYVALGEELPLDCQPLFLDPSYLDSLGFPGSGYSWEQASGLGTVTFSDSGIKNPTFLADQSGDYTVTVNNTVLDVTASDISGTITAVSISGITFSPNTSLRADGISTTEASVTTSPPGRPITWSIINDDLGCTITPDPLDSSKATIKAGITGGRITVRATDSELPSCAAETTIDIVALGNVTFNPPEIPADGTSLTMASATIIPDDRTIIWSISGYTLGCTFNSSTGEIQAGTNGGKIVVTATDSELAGCYANGYLNVVAVEDVIFSNTLIANGTSTSNATAITAPPNRLVEWSIVDDAKGCTIDSATGLIEVTAATTPGTITVRATDLALSSCHNQKDLEITTDIGVVITMPSSFPAYVALDDTLQLNCEPSGDTTGNYLWTWTLISGDPDAVVTFTDPDIKNPIFSADKPGVYKVKVQYTVGSEVAYAEGIIGVIDVDIDLPSFPAYIKLGDTLNLGCTPLGVTTGGSYSWSAEPSTATFTTDSDEDPTFLASQVGEYYVTVGYTVGNATAYDTDGPIYVFLIDLDVDSDQSGAVDGTISEDELEWGEEGQPAIVLPNCDDDDDDKIPDNWTGEYNTKYRAPGHTVGDWDLDGSVDTCNSQVDENGDEDDLAELWIRQMPSLPPGTFVKIGVSMQSSGTYWDEVAPKDMLRIFVPSSPGVLEVQSGDKSIIGPKHGTVAYFKENPNPSDDSEQDIAFVIGAGILKLGVEGIEFGGMFAVEMEFWNGDLLIGSDKVLMKVAPFELCNQTMPVSLYGANEKTVYIADKSFQNEELRDKLREIPPNGYGDYLDEVADPLNNDIWHQDGYEVGRAGGMVIFLVSPRAYQRGAYLAEYVHNKRLAPGVGVCWRLEGIELYPDPAISTYSAFGNVECQPGGNNLFCGSGLHDDIKAFFEAQGVNPRLEVDTSWLSVKHVDEVVSFMPNGDTVVADPVVYLGLCVWANSISQNAYPTLRNKTAHKIIWDYADYNFDTVAQKIKDIRGVLGLANPLTVPVKNGDSQLQSNLKRGGVFTAMLPAGVNTRKYKISFDQGDNIHYSLSYEDNGSGSWYTDSNFYGFRWVSDDGSFEGGTDPTYIRADYHNCIFKEAMCFFLIEFWENTDQITPGDYFTFEVNTNCTILEMPVIFSNGDAYSINHVNSLVDNGKVFSGETHESDTGDVFKNYVEKVFNKAGLSTIFANSWYYHELSGDIHCGTNVQR